MPAHLYIPVPVFNRKEIAAKCIPTVQDGMLSCDFLDVWDDGSTDFGEDLGQELGDGFRRSEVNVGIEIQRRWHIDYFWEQRHAFTHLYLTDADAVHDHNWRSQALGLQQEHTKADKVPIVGLYDTDAHVTLIGNTTEDDPAKNVIFRRVCPGISMLLTVDHVARLMPVLEHCKAFDWFIPSVLGHFCAISRVSHCEHIGLHGLHHPAGADWDGGDRARNPSIYCAAKRAEIIEELKAHE